MDLLAYRGSGPPPEWVDEPGTRRERFSCAIHLNSMNHILPSLTCIDLFTKLCTISAFLSPSKALIRSNEKKKTEKFWRVCCDFVFRFGGTEMKAQIVWFENVSFGFVLASQFVFTDLPCKRTLNIGEHLRSVESISSSKAMLI